VALLAQLPVAAIHFVIVHPLLQVGQQDFQALAQRRPDAEHDDVLFAVVQILSKAQPARQKAKKHISAIEVVTSSSRPQIFSEPVEHTIHQSRLFGIKECVRYINIIIDNNANWNFRFVIQLINTGA